GSFLIVSGPFAYVRNPLYIGNMLLYLGIGIMSLALFPYLQIAAVIFFAIQYYFIVIEEEKFLNDKFGDAYDEYVKNVPRFFMRLIPYKPGNVEQPDYEFKKGLRSEKRTLQAFSSVTIILIIIWAVK
ncbi:MAG TPA: isoprenylcysteine carboxylmethyltransferase family protein, partial [Candidatus Moranbacteria bacterium]|nr:isoprenylcysteine carboxylmethyltransferase family protein [Candidatus Moranbacteria bacterium]